MNPSVRATLKSGVQRLIVRGLHRAMQSSNEGNALVEMAFALPVMMLMVTGMCSFGLCLNNYLILQHATDVGARYLATSRGLTSNPCADTVTVIQNAAPVLAQASLTYTFALGTDSFAGGNTSFSGSGSTSCSVAGTKDLSVGSTATVTVTYPFTLTIYGWTPSSMNLQASTSEIVQ
ncbi:MAG TPA: TadE/TadG family type IV pilus assembly protein [Terracidiphilus sp.]|nr:TadE/TadG family type IV pilus assembly protein [Terracidiphilus sp.]